MTEDDVEILFRKLSARLKEHLTYVDLRVYCRVPLARLAERAFPNIGLIVLVSAADFARLYDELYVSAFPCRAERERSDLITDRLEKEFAAQRQGLEPYRIVGIRDREGAAIQAAQFSVLLLLGGMYAVPYLQYIYIRAQNQRQDLAEVLHTLVLAIATADGATYNNQEVTFTLFETESANYGDDDVHRAIATQRVLIHTRAGAVAVVLRRAEHSALIGPHVQPGPEEDDPLLSLVWAVRPSPALDATASARINIADIGPLLIVAYYQSLRDEGFPESNIHVAENIVALRRRGSVFVTLPLSDVVLSEECRTMDLV